VSDAYQPVFRSAFNLALLLAAVGGIVALLARSRRGSERVGWRLRIRSLRWVRAVRSLRPWHAAVPRLACRSLRSLPLASSRRSLPPVANVSRFPWVFPLRTRIMYYGR
jgi:hypothetical protein